VPLGLENGECDFPSAPSSANLAALAVTPVSTQPYCHAMTKANNLTELTASSKRYSSTLTAANKAKSELMRPAFHPDASFFGYRGKLATASHSLRLD